MITTSRTMRNGLGGLAEPAVRTHNIVEPERSSWWLVTIAVGFIAALWIGAHL